MIRRDRSLTGYHGERRTASGQRGTENGERGTASGERRTANQHWCSSPFPVPRSPLLVLQDRLRGTLAPFFRASDRPIAMACLRLFTFPPFPPRPLRNVPFFRRRIALSTRLVAARPYRRVLLRLLVRELLRVVVRFV